MTNLTISLLCIAIALLLGYVLWLRHRILVAQKKILLLVKKVMDTTIEYGKYVEKQGEVNEGLMANLEILAVHTKLVKPSIAMEAQAFLSWHNKTKGIEEEDGDI